METRSETAEPVRTGRADAPANEEYEDRVAAVRRAVKEERLAIEATATERAERLCDARAPRRRARRGAPQAATLDPE